MTSLTVRYSSEVAFACDGIDGEHLSHVRAEFDALCHEGSDDFPVTIRIRYSDRLTASADTIWLGSVGGYSESVFVMTDGPYLAELSFSGDSPLRCELVVDRRFDPVRFFGYVVEPLLRFAAVEAGLLFVHASSVCIGDRGILFPAWGHTGKTNTMLALTQSHSARFMADDWSIIGAENTLLLNPRSINFFDYNFKRFPGLGAQLPMRVRARLSAVAMINTWTTKTANVAGKFRKVMELVQAGTQRLGNARVPWRTVASSDGRQSARLAVVIALVAVRGSPNPCYRRVESALLARRARAVFEYEHTRCLELFAAWEFATGRATPVQRCLSVYQENLERKLSALPLFELQLDARGEPADSARQIVGLIDDLTRN